MLKPEKKDVKPDRGQIQHRKEDLLKVFSDIKLQHFTGPLATQRHSIYFESLHNISME